MAETVRDAVICLAVIVMRESRIESYDPSFKSPFYPWMQIVGICLPLWLIAEMGRLPVMFTLLLLLVSGVWYFKYARQRVVRDGAIYHVFERLGHHRYKPLDAELRSIMEERGVRESDPIEENWALCAGAKFARRMPDCVNSSWFPQRCPARRHHVESQRSFDDYW